MAEFFKPELLKLGFFMPELISPMPLNTNWSCLMLRIMQREENNWQGYEWTALSVTIVGALLAAIQGSVLLIALPEIRTHLQSDP
jgi:hypothetical protein